VNVPAFVSVAILSVSIYSIVANATGLVADLEACFLSLCRARFPTNAIPTAFLPDPAGSHSTR
jgi:hypothetical protein